MGSPKTLKKRAQKKRRKIMIKARELAKTRKFRGNAFSDLTPLDVQEVVRFFVASK